MKKPRLMITGHGRAGKDTVADFLKDGFGYRAMSSSMFCAKAFIFESLSKVLGYSTLEECYTDRVNHRALWANLIKAYNRKDPARLSREIFTENDIYVGIRSDVEFLEAKREGLFDLAIWIDGSERVPDEPGDSFDISIKQADIVIDNNGTEEELVNRLVAMAGLFL